MARIPAEELERLKQTVAVERLVEAAGIALKKSGQDWVGLCPFHDDHHPSLRVTPHTNLWRCPACGAGGGPIDWVMKSRGVSFRHAVELLRTDSFLAALPGTPVKHSTVRHLASPVIPSEDERAALNQVMAYYHATLQESPEALAYLETRGIHSNEAIAHFKLGYANRTLGYRLPAKTRQAGAHVRGQLQRLGVLRASGHEHFAGSLVIPIVDEGGQVVEMYGRKIRDDLREGTAVHLYLPGPHQGVWNREALQNYKEIILCEALIDALTFWCAGYRNVTSSYGVDGFTADHLATFKQYGTQRVLIAYDRDEAGEKASERLAEKLMNEGIECFRIQFPKGMDANDYALKVTPAAKSLSVVIRKALWLGKGSAPVIMTEATPVNDPSRVAPAPVPLSEVRDEPPPPEVTVLIEPPPRTETVPPSLPSLAAASDAPVHEGLTASPLPRAALPDIPCELHDGEVTLRLGDRRYRVRGLLKNLARDVVLKVNILVSRGEVFHVDTFDLYSPRAKTAFLTQAAHELQVKDDVIRHDLGHVLRQLEALHEAHVQHTLTPAPKDAGIVLAEADKHDALALLQAPNLLERILADLERGGSVGEETNKLVAYLAATSRKLDAPLAVMVQSSSAAGKSALMEAVLAFMPEEDQVKYSAITGQALYYMSGIDLKHKILALAEEAGAARASYALKLLQSEGVLTIASTGKHPETGELVTQMYKVEGPVMIFSTTTAIDNDEELLNRCLTLGVDESREQTRAIHTLQRRKRTLDGLFAKKHKARIQRQHQNAQRLLRPLAVRNPYAEDLTFPDERTRLRRDHEKYLTLIDTIALLHQYQRPVKTRQQEGETIEYVDVTLDDIATANTLAHEALGRSLDELPPQTRRLLTLIDAWVRQTCETFAITRADYRFSRKDVRAHTGWSDFPVKMHMSKLEDLEYVLVHRGGRGQSFVYELLYDGQGHDGRPFLMGLVDVATLKCTYDKKKEHEIPNKVHPSSPQGAVKEYGSSGPEIAKNTENSSADPVSPQKAAKNALLEETEQTVSSYLQRGSYPQNDNPPAPPLAAVFGKKL